MLKVKGNIAEDIIERFVLDQIRKKREYAESSTFVNNRYVISSENLEKVVQELDSIKEGMLKIQVYYKEKNHKQQVAKHSIEPASSSLAIIAKAPPPPSGGKKNTMVGFEYDLIQLKEKLTTYHSHRIVIPIVGMGGIGKTTLATNTYDDPFIKSCFDIRAWASISQDYSFRNIVLCLLHDIEHSNITLEALFNNMRDTSDEKLGEILHKALYRRKYLIVLDDIWSIAAWDDISRFLPDNGEGNGKGSRILITTRLLALAHSLGSSNPYEMKFLNDDVSWDLLNETIFGGGEQICPPGLEEVGRIIAKKCSGLPLSIVVMGGLLKMSEKTREYWNEVAEDVSSIVNNEKDKLCLRILSMSYNQLPIQLKPLFLYMAIFPEDQEVKVSRLIKLWIAEGFLKPPPPDISNTTTLEEMANMHFKDLVDRNLVMVHERNSSGNIKTCKIHDLLRDFTLRVVKKERFLCTEMIRDSKEGNIWDRRFFGLHSRGDIWDNKFSFDRMVEENSEIQHVSKISELLRVFVHMNGNTFLRLHFVMNLSNLRYLAFSMQHATSEELIWFPWNLETLLVDGYHADIITLPSVIWEMQHLRHLKFQSGVQLSMPISEESHYCVLNNLQTLSSIKNFKFTNEILGRIPNLKKLVIVYNDFMDKEDKEEEEKVLHFNQNLVLLQKLETLKCHYAISNEYILKIRLNFPPSLKKLTLGRSRIPWKYMNIVGSLPKLEVLVLRYNAFGGPTWISTDQGDDQFQCLKCLTIYTCDLKIWEADSINFPALEHLSLRLCGKLERIPWGIGEIPSLQSINLYYSTKTAIISVKEIHLEAELQGYNEDLLVEVTIDNEDDELQGLASPKFGVTFIPMPDYILSDMEKLDRYMGDSFQQSIIE